MTTADLRRGGTNTPHLAATAPTAAIENGDLVLPKGPGWGADVNEAFVRAHPPRG
jgi:L-alanine-DL-glutamate epimerase-like enolase superfamily enzyme